MDSPDETLRICGPSATAPMTVVAIIAGTLNRLLWPPEVYAGDNGEVQHRPEKSMMD